MDNIEKSSNSQRKSPQQGRSKALVDAILEATVRILPKVGSRHLTTKKIAEFAGVSIGSLYQYFPNKESVLASLIDFKMHDMSVAMKKKIQEMNGASLEPTTDALVDYTIGMFLNEREKIREIFMQAPELNKMPNVLELRQEVVKELATVMAHHSPGRSREEYVRISFIAANTLMGVIHTMLYDETQNYSREDLACELKVLLKSYFRALGLTSDVPSESAR